MEPSTTKLLRFKVTRQPHEILKPSKPTPHDYKLLSDIDDQEGLRLHFPSILFYRNDSTLVGRDPVKIIREAIKDTLVFYYPFAGRLREVGPGRKLLVECTGEGILFIEADADVALEDFGDPLLPPRFPCIKDLLPRSTGIIDSPLLIVQVTRLRCGGFVLGTSTNHTMCDGAGFSQLVIAISEMARGAPAPSVSPVWQRELFLARNPPRVTCSHHAYDHIIDTNGQLIPQEDMAYRLFHFPPTKIIALRMLLPRHLNMCSIFEVLISYLWKYRAVALQLEPEEEVRICFIVNWRGRRAFPPLPMGYYGNALAFAVAISTAKKLCENPLGYALELIMKAKNDVTEEHFRSLADFLVINGRPPSALTKTFYVSDITRANDGVDFGWGNPSYGGPGNFDLKGITATIPFKNNKGEHEILIPLWLPILAMKRFETELDNTLKTNKPSGTTSAL